jgi:hypothetical protein
MRVRMVILCKAVLRILGARAWMVLKRRERRQRDSSTQAQPMLMGGAARAGLETRVTAGQETGGTCHYGA